MNVQLSHSAIHESLSPLGITADELRRLPGNRDVQLARARVLQDLCSRGLPTRRLESWHYTDLRTRLKAPSRPQAAEGAGDSGSLIPGSIVLQVNEAGCGMDAGIAGLSIRNYRHLLEDGSAAGELVECVADDAIGRINGILADRGMQIEIAGDHRFERPIELQVRGSSHSRLGVVARAGARVTVIERHAGQAQADGGFSTVVSRLRVGEGADVTWIIVGEQQASDSHLGQLRFILERDAKLRILVLNTGGKLVRQEVHGRQSGEGAQLILNGINLLRDAGHTDLTMTLEHEAVGTTSAITVRNVVFDRASGAFQGGIKVGQGAQRTDARMACNTLLLSDDGEFSAKPELEIFADDVQCGHGATIADIDDAQIYYLMARGIPKARARSLLIEGILAELLLPIGNEQIVVALEQIVSAWLEAAAEVSGG